MSDEELFYFLENGKKYMPQLVIEKTDDKIISVGICELEPSRLYKERYRIIKTQRGFWLEVLDVNLIEENSKE